MKPEPMPWRGIWPGFRKAVLACWPWLVAMCTTLGLQRCSSTRRVRSEEVCLETACGSVAAVTGSQQQAARLCLSRSVVLQRWQAVQYTAAWHLPMVSSVIMPQLCMACAGLSCAGQIHRTQAHSSCARQHTWNSDTPYCSSAKSTSAGDRLLAAVSEGLSAPCPSSVLSLSLTCGGSVSSAPSSLSTSCAFSKQSLKSTPASCNTWVMSCVCNTACHASSAAYIAPSRTATQRVPLLLRVIAGPLLQRCW
jgi:hypothetical protein